VQARGPLALSRAIGADHLERAAACPAVMRLPTEVRSTTFASNGRQVTRLETPVGSLQYAVMPSPQGNTNFLVEHPLKTEDDYKVQLWIEENSRVEAAAHQLLGSKVGIIGGIEPTKFLSFDISKLDSYVEEVIADGSGGPFVLANSDSCPPGVTIDKFRQVAEIARASRRG